MDGQLFNREIAFSQPVINIGSDGGNDIILRGESIADFHAMLHFDSNRWYIIPLDPVKKTMLNGRQIDDAGAPVQSGSYLTIGDYRLMLTLNGINADIVVNFQGIMNVSQPEDNTANADANILLSLSDMPVTEIDAGGAIEYQLTVTNAGPLVANMQLQVQGIPTAWVQIIPPVVNLNEGRKGTFTVRVSPPRDPGSRAGLYPLRFIATSPNYQRETTAVNSTLTVLPYSEFMVNGPTPRRIHLKRNDPTDVCDVVILNNSNADSTFIVQTLDDSNELNFSYEQGTNSLGGQEMVTIKPGDNDRIPIRVGAKKLPLFGITNKSHHFFTNVTPSDRPGDAQSVVGEVVVKPQIHTLWLLLVLALLVVGILIVTQPYIHLFDGQDGRHTQVILNGSSTPLNWNVSRFASKVTLDDGSDTQDVTHKGSQYVSPAVSTTYTLRAENFFSRLLGMNYEKTVRVLIIPQRPSVNTFATDLQDALFGQQVTLSWSVGDSADSAAYVYNKQSTALTKETYSGTLTQGYNADTLFSLKAQNESGYEMKSLFLNVSPDRIDLNRFTVWVRPNGIAVPNDNDSRRTQRWSALELLNTTPVASARSSVNPQPAAQSNLLSIPDDFNSANNSLQSMNPEQALLNGGTAVVNTYVYQTPDVDMSSLDLLVSPLLNPTATPTPVPEINQLSRMTVEETAAPATSPEAAPYNRDFSVKLAEVVEDPLSESGYRVIDYFPDYQLQAGEQILVEWNVNGVSKVTIENLSSDQLNNSGGEFAYPEKSLTYVLGAEIGSLKKTFSLPIRVAGAADDGEGSGLNCELKANATTLTVPGSVMLTWSGAGTNRVQLISSAQAEKDNDAAEKQKEAEAKEKGESYTKPTNAPLSGGTIGDWLQPSGFMKVNVDKQTTFMLNAYDGNGNVICTKSVEVKYQGGNDKLNLKLKITKIADENGVSQSVYTVGQTVQYTIEMSDYEKGKDPGGAVMITDGSSSCQVTLPVTTCSFQAKKAGNLTITAVYAGDNTYNKATATAAETVINKLPTTTQIQAALKPGASLADVVAQLTYNKTTADAYKIAPTGTITFTIGSGTCDLINIENANSTDKDLDESQKMKLTCNGTVTADSSDKYWYTITEMLLADASADRVTAAYKGDNFFAASTSTPVLFYKVPTTLTVLDDPMPYKPDNTHANFTSQLGWGWGDWLEEGESITDSDDEMAKLVKDLIPTGTVTFIALTKDNSELGKCVYDLTQKTLGCDGELELIDNSKAKKPGINLEFILTGLLVGETSDRIRIDYSGDALFNASTYSKIFATIQTTAAISSAVKASDGTVALTVSVTPDSEPPAGSSITGTVKFTSDSAACTLNFEDPAKVKLEGCSGTVTPDTTVPGKYLITGMQMTGTPGKDIKAEYSGSSLFGGSTSETVPFGTMIPSIITIEEAKKLHDNDANVDKIDMTVSLTPDADETGTITFTSGAATCTINITDKAAIAFAENCSGTAEYTGGKIKITDMVMFGTPGTSIKADYSGDSKYDKSSSSDYPFPKAPITLEINDAYRSGSGLVNADAVLTWLEADAGDSIPTGAITFTIGSNTCTLDMQTKKLTGCTGEDTGIERDPAKDADVDESLTWKLQKILLSAGNNADRIQAKYSGDSVFEAAESVIVLFKTIPTTLSLSDQSKTSAGLVNVKAELEWTDKHPDESNPGGTIKFTSGSASCTLDLASNKFTEPDCGGTVTPPTETAEDKKRTYTIKDMKIGDGTGTTLKAEYSGDGLFETSASGTIDFNKVNTTLEITDAYKPGSGLANIDIVLSPVPASESFNPTGTITFTIGSDTCRLNVTTKEFNCSGSDTSGLEPDTSTPGVLKWSIKNIVLSSNAADRVKAEYSGDAVYNPSSSVIFMFKTIPTTLSLSNAKKTTDGKVNVDANLSWTGDVPAGVKPAGTIKFTAGSASCSFEIQTVTLPEDPYTFNLTDCEGQVKISDTQTNPYSYEITGMKIGDGTATEIKAEYSGSGMFLASASNVLSFDKIDTTLEVKEAYKPETIRAFYQTVLSWDKTNGETRQPTGTITFTISDTCKMVIDLEAENKVKEFNCSDGSTNILYTNPDKTESGKTFGQHIWNFQNVLLSAGNNADRIVAAYSGDAVFNASTSDYLLLKNIPTTLKLSNGSKTSAGLVNVEADLGWEKTDVPTGVSAAGTIKFTAGSASCSFEIPSTFPEGSTSYTFELTDCDGQVQILNTQTNPYSYKITNMEIGDGTAAEIKAEYSGSGMFLASASNVLSFDKLPTTLTIRNAYKPGSLRANFESLLGWNDAPTGAKPTGTITYTIGGDRCVLTIDMNETEAAKRVKNFTCGDGDTKVTPDSTTDGLIQFEQALLSAATADRIKAEYSGDLVFNASSSDLILFQSIPTTLTITDQLKQPSGKIDLTTQLKWSDKAISEKLPTGTIKLTAGQAVCTLDITLDDSADAKPRLTDCVADEIRFVRGTDTQLYDETTGGFYQLTLKGLTIGDGSAAGIKAEYSGDGVYQTSASDEMFFDKIDTSIDVMNAFKPEAVRATFDAVLTWDKAKANGRTPTGTVTYTIGADVCRLVIDPDDPEEYISFSCETANTEIEAHLAESGANQTLTWNMVKILLSQNNTSDRIKAEYSGDAVFNASASNYVLFDSVVTTTEISGEQKASDGLISGTLTLGWAKEPLSGEAPKGTIKLTSGTATCTLDLAVTPIRFTDCGGNEPGVDTTQDKKLIFTISGLDMGQGVGSDIRAEYSGSGSYQASASDKKSFNKIDTTLSVANAHKSDSIRAFYETTLGWTSGTTDNRKPSGTITFTIGDTCKMVFNLNTNDTTSPTDPYPAEFSCRDDATRIFLTNGTESETAAETSHTRTWSFQKVLLSVGNTADRIKAEYSGDAVFNPSSSDFVLLKTIPTSLEITNQRKNADGEISMNTILRWTDDNPGVTPLGTIRFTSGTGTCTLSLVTETFIDCGEGWKIEPVDPETALADKKLEYVITRLKIGDGTGTNIKAEYTGDGYYLASVSEPKDFSKVDTELDITQAYKPGANLANVISHLSWKVADVEAGTSPTGTITFTVGSDTCKLDIVTEVFSCTGQQTGIKKETEPYTEESVEKIRDIWTITNMILSSNTADRIQAVYSGDGVFNGSSSTIFLFKTIETNLALDGFKKTSSGYLGTTVNLSWGEETEIPYSTMKPSGTIKLTSGTGTCTISFGQNTSGTTTTTTAKWTDCKGDEIEVTPGSSSLSFAVKNLDMEGKAGDSLKAEYSGNVIFLASVSDSQFFNKADTNLNILSPYKGEDGLANLKVSLDWLSQEAGANEPSGSITFTIGSDSCKMDIATKNFSCSGEKTVVSDPEKVPAVIPETGSVTWTWTITNILLSSSTADRVKADYSGDSIFNTSSSRIVMFKNVETTLKIQNPAKTSDGKLSFGLDLSWEDDLPPAGMNPGGSIKITSGTASCTLSFAYDSENEEYTARWTDCQGDPITVTPGTKLVSFDLRNLNIGDKAGDDLKAAYAGDGTFLASSDTHYFDRTNTELEIIKATKAGDYLVDVTTKLHWDTAEAGTVRPQAGTITFTIGSETCKLVYDLEKMDDEDLQTVVSFNCMGVSTHVKVDTTDIDNGNIIWTVTNILLSSNTADRVKADYSGDANFNSSFSKTLMFPTVATTTTISNQDKNSDDKVKLDVALGWASTAPSGKTPTGTIRLISGSAVCEIDISGNTPKFVDPCTGSIQTTLTGNPWTFAITNMDMGTGVGTDIKAEYSGDSVFIESASDTLGFDKVNTVLEISKAWKYDTTSLANIDGTLTWKPEDAGSVKPEGTIKFTIGSETCSMDINTETISCSGTDTEAKAIYKDDEPGKYTLKLRKVLLTGTGADRVKAEYAGDGTFNPSSSTTVMFETKETTTGIMSPIKKNSNKVDFKVAIDWEGAVPEETVKPTGTLVFTSGSKTCTLNLSTEKFTNCTADPVTRDADKRFVIRNLEMGAEAGTTIRAEYSGDSYFLKSVSPTVEFEKVDTTLAIDGAVKTGDGSMADVIMSLKWNQEKAMGNTPTGVITLNIGSDVCKLTIDKVDKTDPTKTDAFTCSGDNTRIVLENIAENADGNTVTGINIDEGGNITDRDGNPVNGNGTIGYRWTISSIVLTSATADRITAAYAGDSIFNASESKIKKFETVDTKTIIENPVKVGDGSMVDVDVLLKWKKAEAALNEPTGTMTLAIGSDTCKLTIDSDDIVDVEAPYESVDSDIFTCAGEDTKFKMTRIDEDADGYIGYKLSLTNIVLTSSSAERITASYGGDHIFNKSDSLIVKFKTVETQTTIRSQRINPDGTVNVVVDLTWDQEQTGVLDEDHLGTRPSGTIKFTAGGSTCTLRIKYENSDAPEFTDCDVRQASLVWTRKGGSSYWYPEFQIYDLKIGDGTAPSIKAEYSGDGLFLKSESDEMFFKHLDTELEITKAYKPSDIRANLETTLSWCSYGCGVSTYSGDNPVGSITFTIGSDTCKLDLSKDAASSFVQCSDASTVVTIPSSPEIRVDGDKSYKDWKLKLTNILLSDGNTGDRVKAEFGGDKLFNASSSIYVLLEKIETQTSLISQVKMPDGSVNVDLSLSWMDTPPEAALRPTGTVKFTSGTDSCTLDLSAKKFTGCSGTVSDPTEEDSTRTYKVTGLKLGDGTGSSIKAEYSGDTIFQGSSSNELYFTKVDTELEFISAFKPNDAGLANTVTLLSWNAQKAANRKPTGTVKYTVGSGSCTLDLSSGKMDDCDSLEPIKIETYSSSEKLGYKITIENMALSDTTATTIKAEYSGDPVFNASSRQASFKTVDTTIIIRSSYKPDEKHATVTAVLNWDETEAEGRTPRGTVKFVVGSGSCSLIIDTGMLSCQPDTGTVSDNRKTFKVKDMLLDDSSADRVSAEYSGDSFFNSSKSTKVLFERIDTEITVNRAYRYKKNNTGCIWLESQLGWNDIEDEGKTPTGTLTVTVGEKTAVYDITAKTLTINGTQVEDPETYVEVDQSLWQFTFKNLPLGVSLDLDNTDAPSIDYSGDIYFGLSSASGSFSKIKTVVDIKSGSISFSGNLGYDFSIFYNLTVQRLDTLLNDIPFDGNFKFSVQFIQSDGYRGRKVDCSNEEGSWSCSWDQSGPSLSRISSSFDGITGEFSIDTMNGSTKEVYSRAEITVKYNGDVLYAASDNATYATNKTPTEITSVEAVQLNDGMKYVKFTVNKSSLHDTVVLTTSNGKTCTYNIDNPDKSCGEYVGAEMLSNTSQTIFTLKNMTFDPEKADKLYIQYLPSGSQNSSYKEIGFKSQSTTLSFSQGTLKNNADGTVNMNLNLTYTSNELDGYRYPGGPLVITKGTYTCTIPLKFDPDTVGDYRYDLHLASVSTDCGGGTAHVWSSSEGPHMVIELSKLPVTDHQTTLYKARYGGDWLNNPSEAESTSHYNQTESKVAASYTSNERRIRVTVSTADEGKTNIPSGTVEMKFKPNGNTCTWNLAAVENFITCNTVFYTDSPATSESLGSKTLVLDFESLPSDYSELELSYSGDEFYKTSNGTFPLPPSEVIITPLTDALYDDGGRLYFNVKTNTPKFPKFPEIYKITDCDNFPGECRDLKHYIPLRASIRVKDYYITDIYGEDMREWPFSEIIYFTAGEDFSVSCAPRYAGDDGNDRLYICDETRITGEAFFTSTGIKHVHVSLGATWLNKEASAYFPDMVAVKVPASPLYGTTTITNPVSYDEISVGSPVTVEADTVYNGESIHLGGAAKTYIYYTWTDIDGGNTRIDVQPDTGSVASTSLEITDNTKWIVAEFLGNDTYAPSTGFKKAAPSTVSLSLEIGGEGG